MAILYVSHYAPKPQAVPPPSVPLAVRGIETAADTSGRPAPARVETIRYALVDQHDRLSPWSDPVTLTFAPGGGAFYDPSEFVDLNDPDVCGLCWTVDGEIALVSWGGVSPRQMLNALYPVDPVAALKIRPWAPLRPEPTVGPVRGGQGYATPPGGTSAVLTAVPRAPVFHPFDVPNVDLEVTYCWLTPEGETAQSPPVASPRRMDYPAGGVGVRSFFLYATPPVGATGYRVYGGANGHSLWMGDFPLDVGQPACRTARHRKPTPGERSVTVNPLQQALLARQSQDVVVVDVPETVTAVPILDVIAPGHVNTKMTGLHGMPWSIRYTGGGEVALLVQACYATYEGMSVHGGYRATSNTSGGQAFGLVFRGCVFHGGVRCLPTSAGCPWNDHVESESYFDDCRIAGPRAVVIGGNQAANWRFHRTHVHSDVSRKPGTCGLWIDTGCLVTFGGGLFLDFGSRLAYLGAQARLKLDDLFTDQGAAVLFEGMSYYPSRVKIRGNQINAQAVGGKVPWLGRWHADVALEDVAHMGGWRQVQPEGVVPA
jgi:hypothetical protein